MKQSLLLLLIPLTWSGSFGQSGIAWQPAIAVGSPNYNNQHPRITLDGAGYPVVLWGDAPAKKAWFSHWNGAAFTAPLSINPASIPVFADSWAGPDLASRGDTVYVVFKKTPEAVDTNHIYLRRSFDGGQSFDPPVRVDYIADSISRFPTVGIDSAGHPLVGFMKFDPVTFGNARWVVARSTDYGMTFQPDVPASGYSGGTVCDCCPGTMTSEGSRTVIAYRDNLSNLRNIWAGISTDDGLTFPAGLQVDKTNWIINSCPASGPDAVLQDDTLFAVYMSGASGTSRVYWSKSSVGGMAWVAGGAIAGGIPGLGVQNYPRIDRRGQAAAIAWKQTVSGKDMLPLLFTNNIHNGFQATYDTVALGNTGTVVNTDVAVSNDAVHVVWEDNATNSLWYRKGLFSTTSVGDPPAVGHGPIVLGNPVADGNLVIGWDGAAPAAVTWTISDLAGRMLASGTDHPRGSTLRMPVPGLAGGVYLWQPAHGRGLRFAVP